MSNDINVLTITGRLGGDSELRYTGDQKAVLSFSVGNNVGYGEKKKINWFKCALFGKPAESDFLQKALKKGASVTITGEIGLNKNEHKGKSYADMQVFVKSIQVHLCEKVDIESNTEAQQSSDVPQSSDDFDDDIPF